MREKKKKVRDKKKKVSEKEESKRKGYTKKKVRERLYKKER